jgi:CheY-like chemotaxis protein
MVEALHQRGFVALAARDGSEALRTFDAIRDAPLDVIVLDLAMPVMDGHAFLAARAERQDLAFVPVIIISGTPPDRDLASSVWNEYLPKPLHLDALVEAVARCAQLGRKLAPH